MNAARGIFMRFLMLMLAYFTAVLLSFGSASAVVLTFYPAAVT